MILICNYTILIKHIVKPLVKFTHETSDGISSTFKYRIDTVICYVRSAFLDDAIFNALNSDLREKIKLKLEKVNQMDQAAITCFVHGAFTRSKVLYKENGSDNYIRLIDLENVSVHSPVIDVGPILLTNLPTINNVSTLERFLKEMIHYYITMASNEYPFLNAVLLKTEIIDYLLFSYLNLNATEMEDIKHHISLLNALENLGSFNI